MYNGCSSHFAKGKNNCIITNYWWETTVDVCIMQNLVGSFYQCWLGSCGKFSQGNEHLLHSDTESGWKNCLSIKLDIITTFYDVALQVLVTYNFVIWAHLNQTTEFYTKAVHLPSAKIVNIQSVILFHYWDREKCSFFYSTSSMNPISSIF